MLSESMYSLVCTRGYTMSALRHLTRASTAWRRVVRARVNFEENE